MVKGHTDETETCLVKIRIEALDEVLMGLTSTKNLSLLEQVKELEPFLGNRMAWEGWTGLPMGKTMVVSCKA